MNRTLVLAVSLAISTWSAAALADKTVSIKGKAPPAEPAPEKAKTIETKKPFDFGELGARDAAADKAIAKVMERCVSDPFSREGPTVTETARCNAAVARLTAFGKKAAPSIFAALNSPDGLESYYAMNRLLFALGKIDDKKVRSVAIDGFATIAKEESDVHASFAYQIPESLEAMMGATPPVQLPWEPSEVSDPWEEHRKTAGAWKEFAADNEDKTRKQIASAHLAKARKEKTDDDPAAAYRAIAFLVARSPLEAKRAAEAYLKREGLEGDVESGFDMLKSQAEWKIEEQQAATAALARARK